MFRPTAVRLGGLTRTWKVQKFTPTRKANSRARRKNSLVIDEIVRAGKTLKPNVMYGDPEFHQKRADDLIEEWKASGVYDKRADAGLSEGQIRDWAMKVTEKAGFLVEPGTLGLGQTVRERKLEKSHHEILRRARMDETREYVKWRSNLPEELQYRLRRFPLTMQYAAVENTPESEDISEMEESLGHVLTKMEEEMQQNMQQ